MKRFFPFFLVTIVFTYCFWAASCEASKTDRSPCDTLTVSSGKAQSIQIEAKHPLLGKVISNYIIIQDSSGKIVAYKDKEGWKVVDAGKALEVLIVDLEICKQKK